MNQTELNERELIDIVDGVVLAGCQIRDIDGFFDEDTEQVVFVVGYMNEYSTESAWVVKRGVYDINDGEYYNVEIDYQTADEDEDKLRNMSHDDRKKAYYNAFIDAYEAQIL